MTASWHCEPAPFFDLTRARAPADITSASARRSPARLRAPHPLQHILHGARGDRKLLRVAGAQDHVGIGPVLRIEERIAADRHFGIGLGNLAELGADVALARVRAQRLRQHANAGFELGATSSSIACMMVGTPAMTMTLPIQIPGAPDTLLSTRSAPLGMRVMRSRASFISAPVARSRSCRMARARGSTSIGTPNALATQSAVMSSWVGPMPPVVKT